MSDHNQLSLCKDEDVTITLKGTSFQSNSKSSYHDEASIQPIGSNPGCFSPMSQKTWIGLVIVFLLAVSWVGAQQFAQSAVLSENFFAPFFTTWFGTCWMTLCFPVYAMFLRIFVSKNMFDMTIRESLCIFGLTKMKVRQIFTHVLPFNILWIVVNYLYIYSLSYIAATDASAILSSNVAFVYILSFVLLGELFYFTRTVASLLCIAGVVLFGYGDGFQGGNNLAIGVIMAVFSAIGSAVYKVLFKRVLGEGRLGQVSLFLSLLGLTNAVFLWIVFLILYFTGLEEMIAADIPWTYLCGSACLSLIFNFLVNFGVAYTYPLFISVAMMLGIPLNAAVDLLFRDELFSILRLVAALLVVAGFVLMMTPDSWNLPFHRFTGVTSSRCYGNQSSEDDDAVSINDEEHTRKEHF